MKVKSPRKSAKKPSKKPPENQPKTPRKNRRKNFVFMYAKTKNQLKKDKKPNPPKNDFLPRIMKRYFSR